jgi:4-hydroxy-2-oxoheptanedioate aldolase
VLENRTRASWAEGRCAVNLWLSSPSPGLVEAVGRTGFDSVLLDMQHAPLDFKDVYHAQIALGDSPITSLVRVPGLVPSLMMQLLDAGVGGIMCPQVDTREQAEAFVRACRYPPLGTRSFGPYRAARGGSMADYFAVANGVVITMAQVESVTSLENVDEIVSTPGLDAVFVGPADLSISGGGPPEINYQDSTVEARHRRIIESAHAAGVKVGVLAPTQEDLETVLDWGVDMVSCASDTALVLGGAAASLASTRAAIENNVAGRSALAQA